MPSGSRVARLAPIAALGAAALLLAGCGGKSTASIALTTWKCVQAAQYRYQLEHALENTGSLPTGSRLANEERSLVAPGLAAASFIDPTFQRVLPYGAQSPSQLDTFSAWLELDAPPGSQLARSAYAGTNTYSVDDYATAIDDACRKPTFPERPVWSANNDDFGLLADSIDPSNGVGEIYGRTEPEAPFAAEAYLDAAVRGSDSAVSRFDLANLLGGTFGTDLLASAASAPADEAYDGDGDGLLGSIVRHGPDLGLRLSASQILDVVLALRTDHPELVTFLDGIAQAQATVIRSGMTPGASIRWGDRIGAFDGILEEAVKATNDPKLGGEAVAMNTAVIQELSGRHKAALRALDRPPPTNLSEFGDWDQDFVNGMDLAIDAGYVDAAPPGAADEIATAFESVPNPPLLNSRGRLPSFADMTALQQGTIADWFTFHQKLLPAGARTADTALQWRFDGCCPSD